MFRCIMTRIIGPTVPPARGQDPAATTPVDKPATAAPPPPSFAQPSFAPPTLAPPSLAPPPRQVAAATPFPSSTAAAGTAPEASGLALQVTRAFVDETLAILRSANVDGVTCATFERSLMESGEALARASLSPTRFEQALEDVRGLATKDLLTHEQKSSLRQVTADATAPSPPASAMGAREGVPPSLGQIEALFEKLQSGFIIDAKEAAQLEAAFAKLSPADQSFFLTSHLSPTAGYEHTLAGVIAYYNGVVGPHEKARVDFVSSILKAKHDPSAIDNVR